MFSLATSRSEDKTRDNQTTDRFEVKNEVDRIVSSSLNVTANASLTYDNKPAMITASASAGFGYTNASQDHTQVAQNFARDAVSKAVDQLKTETSTQRTVTQHFETDELNSSGFNNVVGQKHIAGIYPGSTRSAPPRSTTTGSASCSRCSSPSCSVLGGVDAARLPERP